MRIIGAADEFWRIRVTRVDTTNDFDFEWHDDILYREPKPEQPAELELWQVEAVRLDDFDTTVCLASYDSRVDAEKFYEQALLDLVEMTKMQFEESYLPESSTTV